jgi:hypothetical protein
MDLETVTIAKIPVRQPAKEIIREVEGNVDTEEVGVLLLCSRRDRVIKAP